MSKVLIDKLYTPQLGYDKTLRIVLPDDYHQNSDKRYPVLYMHDGQSLFEKQAAFGGVGWDMLKALEQFKAKTGQGIILVGIDNNGLQRFTEYSPWECTILKQAGICDPSDTGGKGHLYAEFLANTLKPYIDDKYRTLKDKQNTAILGSSMGGVISLFCGITNSSLYGTVGAFSTACWTAYDEMKRFLEQSDIDPTQKFFLSVGTNEGHAPQITDLAQRYLDGYSMITKTLAGKGVSSDNIHSVIDEGAEHNELCWQRLIPPFLKFAFTRGDVV